VGSKSTSVLMIECSKALSKSKFYVIKVSNSMNSDLNDLP